MALAKGHQANLNTIVRAAQNDNLAVLECYDRMTRAAVPVLVAIHMDKDHMIVLTPLARMFIDDPYKELIGPGETDYPDAPTLPM